MPPPSPVSVCGAGRVCVRAAKGEKRGREEVEAPVPSSLSLYPPFLTSHMLQTYRERKERGPSLPFLRLPSHHRQAANGDPRRRRPIISYSNGRFPPPPPKISPISGDDSGRSTTRCSPFSSSAGGAFFFPVFFPFRPSSARISRGLAPAIQVTKGRSNMFCALFSLSYVRASSSHVWEEREKETPQVTTYTLGQRCLLLPNSLSGQQPGRRSERRRRMMHPSHGGKGGRGGSECTRRKGKVYGRR